MTEIIFEKRRAFRIENEQIRVTATVEGGHIAEIQHKPFRSKSALDTALAFH